MLVLTRKEGTRIIVTCGDVEISVTVVDARSGSARLGVEAPASVRVLRDELHGDPAGTASPTPAAVMEVGR